MSEALVEFLISLALGAIVTYGTSLIIEEQKPQLKKKYVEYETAKEIADNWHNNAQHAECKECGMDDVAAFASFWGDTKCKFCMELANLNYHLRYNGSRK